MTVLVDGNSIFKRIFYSIYKFKKNDIVNISLFDDSEFYKSIIGTLYGLTYKFSVNRVDIIILFDSKVNNKYFRNNIYEDYKKNRLPENKDKNSIALTEYYNRLLNNIRNLYLNNMYNILSFDLLEAEDISHIITQNILKEFIVVTYDKDFNQSVIEDRVNIYNPLLDELLNKPLSRFDYEYHIMFGDKADVVPSVFQYCQYSEVFKSYLVKKNIDIDDPFILEDLDVFSKLKKDFLRDNKTIYRRSSYRIKHKEIQTLLFKYLDMVKETPILNKHYLRNKELIDLNYIPQIYTKPVLQAYNSLKPKSLNTLDLTSIEQSLKQMEIFDLSIFKIV